MIVRTLLAALSVVTLAGCTVKRIDYASQLESAAPCCTTYEKMPGEKIEFNGEGIRFHLGDEHGVVVEEEKEKIYALKLILPNFVSPYSIRVQSPVHLKSAFVPKLVLLDKDHRVSRTFDHKDFIFNHSKYEATLFVNDTNNNEHYLVISEDLNARSIAQKTTSVEVNTVYTSGVSLSYGSGDITSTITSSKGGIVLIGLNEYKLRTLSDIREDEK